MRKLMFALVMISALSVSLDGSTVYAKAKKAATVTKAQALKMVAARPEVKKFMANVQVAGKERGCTANIEYDRLENGEHVIHVFELVPDGDDSGHTATFNWYHVNAKTGKISKEF